MGNSSNKLKGENHGSVDWKGDKDGRNSSDSTNAEEDVPAEYHNKILKAGLNLTICDTHLPETLSVLHFLYKRRFRIKKPSGWSATVPNGLSGSSSGVEVDKVSPPLESFETVDRVEIIDGPSSSTPSSSTPLSTSLNNPPLSFFASTPFFDETQQSSPITPSLVPSPSPVSTPSPPPPSSSDEITVEDLAREARTITEGDPATLFRHFTSHGQGGFGRVEKAKHTKTKSIVAIKRMPHTTVKQRKANMQEVHFLRLLRGKPNIVNYYATFRKGEEIWLVMEFMEGGTLGQAASKRIMNESHVAYLAREILKGIATIHSLNLVHRDLKPHNIMIDIDGAVKLIDFGLCLDLQKNKNTHNMVGSSYWMAPEMILRKPYGTAVDIWSFGIVMFEVLLGKPINHHLHPFKAMFETAIGTGPNINDIRVANAANTSSKSNEDAADSIFGGLVSASKVPWSENAYDFVKQCLTYDPALRPSANDLLAHPFLKSADDQREMRRILKVIFLSDSLTE